MKTIVNISFGPSREDYDFKARFMGQDYHIIRFGTDNDINVAGNLLTDWDGKADAIGLSYVRSPYGIGPTRLMARETEKLVELGQHMKTPFTTGDALRNVGHEWTIRHIQYKFGNNYFNNSRVLFLSGMINARIAKALSEYTANLKFCDPIFEDGIPKLINSLSDLELYARDLHPVLQWVPSKKFSQFAMPLRSYNLFILRQAMQQANIIVLPDADFFWYLQDVGLKELGGKIVITTTAYEDRVNFLKEHGVSTIIDTTPKILEQVVGVSVLEAMIMLSLGKTPTDLTRDDLLEFITELRMDPRVIYPYGEEKRVNRFAFVVHPLSQDYLKKLKPVGWLSRFMPRTGMNTIERFAAYAPPFVYSKVTGIKSPEGIEAEGWLIAIGATPRQMLSRGPEFVNARLLKAASIAKNLGAQIVGLGTLTKPMGDAGVTVAKFSDIPITTGNSYSASAALWAAAETVRKIGLIKPAKNKKLKAKTMVIGATGAVGSVCSKLLATAFDEVYMVDEHDAKLLALRESILNEIKDVTVHVTTRADKYIEEMDVIVTATAMERDEMFDLTSVKPGCVITDVNRPLNFTVKDAKKRPDVMIVASGEIELPGQPEMRDIGLPPGVAYASLAEAIVLALEGRFENFSLGGDIHWERVSEIYKLGLKHGMRLAAISGLEGVLTDEDFQQVRELAIKERKDLQLEPAKPKKKSKKTS